MNKLKTSEKCGIIETLNWIEAWEKKNRSIMNHAAWSMLNFSIASINLVSAR